ncbi:hypothetical protein HU200_062268 [Digitaria exilis]|uniref:Uncharacterized protein n=1 Tax=Digitaria exilis TaxID=1010633 RepID=A0A835A7T2_9POAL|nr:hypothetical protein HU200_062268 [Digitaria exilis]
MEQGRKQQQKGKLQRVLREQKARLYIIRPSMLDSAPSDLCPLALDLCPPSPSLAPTPCLHIAARAPGRQPPIACHLRAYLQLACLRICRLAEAARHPPQTLTIGEIGDWREEREERVEAASRGGRRGCMGATGGRRVEWVEGQEALEARER